MHSLDVCDRDFPPTHNRLSYRTHPRCCENLRPFPNTCPTLKTDAGCLRTPASSLPSSRGYLSPSHTSSGQQVAGSPHCAWAVLAESGCLWGQPPAQRLLHYADCLLRGRSCRGGRSQLTQPLSLSFEMIMRGGDDPRPD